MDDLIRYEMNFCRRCGQSLTKQGHKYICPEGHESYANSIPAAGIILLNENDEVLLLRRNIEPHKGSYTIPGGVCNGAEPAEHTAVREVWEETKIERGQYGELTFVCTAIDPYPFLGEVIAAMPVIFTARLKGTVQPQIDGESQSAGFIDLRTFDIESMKFPALRQALHIVRGQLSH